MAGRGLEPRPALARFWLHMAWSVGRRRWDGTGLTESAASAVIMAPEDRLVVLRHPSNLRGSCAVITDHASHLSAKTRQHGHGVCS
jgi:hypothetical protein